MNWFFKKQKDPVCGMDIGKTQFQTSHDGTIYSFCSENCKTQFDNNPDQYLSKSQQQDRCGCC